MRGVKGHRDNWPGAAHLVSIMAQMDDNIARQVVGDMKKNVRDYSKEKYAMMVTLLAKSSSPVMRELLKDLYASISDSKNKKVQDKQAVVLQYMRFSMKLDDLDDVMKILQQKNVSSDLVSSAFRTARYPVSYTHLDVYKRQEYEGCRGGHAGWTGRAHGEHDRSHHWRGTCCVECCERYSRSIQCLHGRQHACRH